jgi:hypothetical protein
LSLSILEKMEALADAAMSVDPDGRLTMALYQGAALPPVEDGSP